jgi:GT2 family glycosyltransferase
MQADPRTGIVMITWNRRNEVLRSLYHLTALPEQPKIILVDNGSEDGVACAVRDNYPQVVIIELEKNVGCAARNEGVKALDVPYIAFCDDDTWWEPGNLSQAANLFDGYPKLGLLMGRVLIGEAETEDPICQEIIRSPLKADRSLPGYPLLGFLGGASIIRRSAFLNAGGYREEIGIGGEEDWLAADLLMHNWELRYLPELCVHHYPSPYRNIKRRKRQILCNSLCFAWLRRPCRSAIRKTASLAFNSPYDRTTLAAFAGAAWRIIRRWRERDVVSAEIEQGYRLLQEQKKRSLDHLKAGENAKELEHALR